MNVANELMKQDERAIYGLRSLYRSYGYSPFKMSKFEEYDLYVRNKSFLVSDHIITFTDMGGKLMALKPDVTLSIVKNSKDTAGGVQKVYYDENVYRVSGGHSSYREIMQAGLECIGDVDRYCVAEVLMLAVESLSRISDDFVLDVSHLGILTAVLDTVGVSDKSRAALLHCVSEKNLHGIDEICLSEGLDPSAADSLKTLITGYGDAKRVLAMLAERFKNDEMQAMLAELSEVLSALPEGKIRIDFSVVNDLGYYNGIVFNGFINGIPQSILSGGQYDNLMRKMGRRSGAIGFAVYLDLLEELQREPASYDVDTVLLYEPTDTPARIIEAVRSLSENERYSVTAERSIPEKTRYRRLFRLTKEGVEELETNA